MKHFITLLLMVSLFSCREVAKGPPLQLNKFIYSAYRWRLNDSTNNYDFYLDQYLDIDSNGKCRILHHEKFGGNNPKYFIANVNAEQLSELNALFVDKTYKSEYGPDTSIIYDGLTYNIDYLSPFVDKTNRNEFSSDTPPIYDGFTHGIEYLSPKTGHHIIQFIPGYAPISIQNLKTKLEHIIFDPDNVSAKQFILTEFRDSMKVWSVIGHSLPPPPKIINFNPPAIK
jgi:hypothetical protein